MTKWFKYWFARMYFLVYQRMHPNVTEAEWIGLRGRFLDWVVEPHTPDFEKAFDEWSEV